MFTTTMTCPTEIPWDLARLVVARLTTAGHETWMVGGGVRDLLLGVSAHDVDVTTAAHPEQVEALFPHTVAVGKAFGVITVVHGNGQHTDVATFRSDGVYSDGRRPTAVRYGSALEDVERRDFTINALLFDPLSGRVVDHVGGVADLEHRQLRTVGDAVRRFSEDRLRILRGVRFAARLGLTIDDHTWAALCAGNLRGLSAERIIQEWDKALTGANVSTWLRLLATSGHLSVLQPTALTDGERSVLATALDRIPTEASLAVRRAVWLHRQPVDTATAWLLRQPGSRDQRQRSAWLLAQPTPKQLMEQPLAARVRLLREPGFSDLLEFFRSVHADDQALKELLAAEQQQRNHGLWRAFLQAGDLLALGCRPGPALGSLLRAVEDAQAEGRVTDREHALALARKRLAESGS